MSRVLDSEVLAVVALLYVLIGFPLFGRMAADAGNLVGCGVLFLLELGSIVFWAYFLDRLPNRIEEK